MQRLLDGLQVLDLGHDPAARAARILGDLGAAVVRVVPPSGDPLGGNVARAWNAGKDVRALEPGDNELRELLAAADVVFDTPGFAGLHALDPSAAPNAVWVRITPFGAKGPRSDWRATDLGVMAASSNMYATGDPDRAPVRCTEPTAYAHTGPEAAFAALTARWTGRPQSVDVSMQEVVLVANMTTPTRFPQTGFRGTRRGANIGRTREIWPTKDGFVSFGLRGGKARVPSLELLSELTGAEVLTARDWSEYNQNTVTDDEIRAIEEPIAEYFASHTMQELYDIACETNLMLAPANSPRGDLRVRAARGARLLRPRRRGRAVPTFVRRRPVGRRRGRTRSPRTGAVCGGACPAGAANVQTEWETVGGRQHPRVRVGRGGADRDALLRRAGRDRAARGVEVAARLPARVRTRTEQSARPRRRGDVRRAQRRQAERHPEPEASRFGRARAAPRRGMGRRRRRELCAARHARLRARLRRARADQARPRDGQCVPERPDRSAPRLPRLRRAGLCARGLQRAHGLGRP